MPFAMVMGTPVLVSLAVALMGALVATRALQRLRRRRRASHERVAARATAVPPPRKMAAPAPAPPVELVCPGCKREYPAGLRFCPHDARALVPHEEHSGPAALFCPACRRTFEGRARFCPFDAEELIPAPPLQVVAARAVNRLPRALGKICPSCAQRYDSEATICRRDGAELVSVN